MKAPKIAAAAALAAVTVLGVACSDSETSKDPTTTTAAPGSSNESNSGSAADAALLGEIEERGEPTLEPVEGEVTELVITDDVVGTGAEVKPGDTVTAHYSGVLAADGTQFDSSWERGEPATFPLDQVIAGWTEGLVGMKEGGRRTLVIPAEMAYGAQGRPGIPANAPLVFTVDLVSVS